MRQRSERAGAGTGRGSSSNRSRRMPYLYPDRVAQRYQGILALVTDPAFVVSPHGDIELLTRPSSTSTDQLSLPLDTCHTHLNHLAPPIRRALAKGIEKAFSHNKPVRITYQRTLRNQRRDFEVRLMQMDESEVIGVVRELRPRETPDTRPRKSTIRRSRSDAQSNSLIRVRPADALKTLENQRRAMRHQISRELAQAVIPIVARMKERARPSQLREAQFFEAQLNAILATDINPFWERYAALTPREMELCELLKGGLSSRQISHQMGVALATVHKHREQIRRKLEFQNKRVNLSSYLRLHALPVRE